VAVFLALGTALGPSGLNVLDVGLESPQLRVLAILALTLVLFSDAVTLDTKEIRAQRTLALRVLGPGTVLPAAIVAVLARFILDMSWPAAAIVGCALPSTDPVQLRSVLRSRAMPPGPRVALRLETGMNDVVVLPIVVFSILVLGRAGGGALTAASLAHHALGLLVLGPAAGAAIGSLGILALKGMRARFGVRRDFESLYALGLAFTAYAAAEALGGSGFVAAFAAGMMVAWQDVELCDCFLEYGEATAEMLLLLTFVALGTSLIWSGLSIIDWRTSLFAVLALATRTVVLYPMLGGMGLGARDRRIVALFGPRGLSSLLFVLLPVFAGLPGASRLFEVTALVVLLSVVVHGGGIALFLRRNREPKPVDVRRALPVLESTDDNGNERITLDELRSARTRGEEVVIVDARADKSYRADERTAEGAVRVQPDDPVRDATELRLSQTATLAVYCA
jgi:NhaP-type Na+/H+ or K+/H+ antiporter